MFVILPLTVIDVVVTGNQNEILKIQIVNMCLHVCIYIFSNIVA